MSTYIEIQDVAVRLTRKEGLLGVTRNGVAHLANIAPSLLYHYFDSVGDLRSRVMEIAVDTQDAELLKHGIVCKHPIALTAPRELREEALELLSDEIMEG